MANISLIKDPYNLIITGVGGQGNVMASRLVGNMMVRQGLHVTIGETFGASQRGGSVMSHLRISEKSSWSPQIPKGCADLIVALEPTEAVRLLHVYGHEQVKVLSNTRAIQSVDVIAGEAKYPSIDELIQLVKEITGGAWFIDATEKAIELGNPILSNTIMLGAMSGMDVLPMDKGIFEEVFSETMGQAALDINMKAYDLGSVMIGQA